MKKWVESLILALLAIAPSILAILSMHQYGQFGVSCALVLSGIYLLILATVLSTRCCRQQNASHAGDQESRSSDSPPSYEVVTSKPPPYHLLFASTTTPEGTASGTTTTKYECAPVHGPCTEELPHDSETYACMEDSCRDPSLPSYSEAMSPSSQHPSVVSHLPA